MTSPRRQAWIGLGLRTRREVIRLAKEGRSHPDPAVDKVARAWAVEAATTSPDWIRDLSGAGARWAERRLGRRILAATPDDLAPWLRGPSAADRGRGPEAARD